VAHDAVSLAPRLPLHPSGRQPPRRAPHGDQPHARDDPRRPVARSGMDLPRVGRLQRGRPGDRSPPPVARPRPRDRPGGLRTDAGTAADRHVPPGLPGWVSSVPTPWARRSRPGASSARLARDSRAVLLASPGCSSSSTCQRTGLPGARGVLAARTGAPGAALALVLFAITTLGAQGVTPFIYFRF
jgi:hypothetical protein